MDVIHQFGNTNFLPAVLSVMLSQARHAPAVLLQVRLDASLHTHACLGGAKASRWLTNKRPLTSPREVSANQRSRPSTRVLHVTQLLAQRQPIICNFILVLVAVLFSWFALLVLVCFGT